MRIKVTKAHDLVVKETKNGRPLATVSFTPSDEPITTKRDWGDALVKARAGVEVKEPVRKPDNDPKVMKSLRAAVGADSGGD